MLCQSGKPASWDVLPRNKGTQARLLSVRRLFGRPVRQPLPTPRKRREVQTPPSGRHRSAQTSHQRFVGRAQSCFAFPLSFKIATCERHLTSLHTDAALENHKSHEGSPLRFFSWRGLPVLTSENGPPSGG